MTEQLIDLKLIKTNPYQPRTTDDAEHIKKLAASIAADGLLQTPKARKGSKGTYELAYGHSRFLAIEHNQLGKVQPDRYDGWTKMPLEIVELTDDEMSRYAITENVHRKDLSPIELAKAMVVRRDQFKETSEQIGTLFGMGGATVRGMIRLLNLPETIRGKVESGEIPQGAARKLVSALNYGLSEEDLEVVVEDIATGEEVDDAIENALEGRDNVVKMWESWRSDKEKPKGGSNLWSLATPADKFPSKHLPAMTVAEAAKIVSEGEKPRLEYNDKIVIQGRIDHFQRGGKLEQMPGYQTTVVDLGTEQTKQNYERLAHLINPPACTDCPFHVVLDRAHYCTLKPCHQRKTKAWITDEINRISKRLSIPVYDPATDGKVFVALVESTWDNQYKTHEKWAKDKDAGLRVAPHKNEYSKQKWTESNFARLIMVGDKATASKERKENSKSKEQETQAARERQWALERERRNASDKFLEEYAQAHFVAAFKEMTNVMAICALIGATPPSKEKAKKKDTLYALQQRMTAKAVSSVVGWDVREKGPDAVAKRLQGVAIAWGVKLPADFLKIAEGYAGYVSIETPKKEKKA